MGALPNVREGTLHEKDGVCVDFDAVSAYRRQKCSKKRIDAFLGPIIASSRFLVILLSLESGYLCQSLVDWCLHEAFNSLYCFRASFGVHCILSKRGPSTYNREAPHYESHYQL